jgi:protein O-GlcNAc transferase
MRKRAHKTRIEYLKKRTRDKMNEGPPKIDTDNRSTRLSDPEPHDVRTDDYWKSGNLSELEESYKRVIAAEPSYDAYINLGETQMALGKWSEALHCFKNAHVLKPDDCRALLALADAFSQSGDPKIACLSIAYYKKALELNPGNARIYNALGVALNLLGEHEEAIDCIKQALKIDPDLIGAQFNLCMAEIPILYDKVEDILASRQRYRQRLEHLVHTLKLDTPRRIAEAAEAVGFYQPFYLAYQGHNDRDLQRLFGELVCRIQAARYPQWAARPPLPPLNPGQPLRVGVVTGFFYGHSNWKIFIKGWVENLNKERYQLYGYYTDAVQDARTEEAKRNFVRFVENIYALESLAKIIRDDQLHLLIYPEVGMNTWIPRLAALRLAPIQCVSWGHPITSGLPTVDYFLSSEFMEPAGAQAHYTERLVKLPRLSTCYTPPEFSETGLTRADFGLKDDGALFFCPQSLFKYLPQYDEVFPRIAQGVGKSCQFAFIQGTSIHLNKQFQRRLEQAFSRYGLDAQNYVTLLPRMDSDRYLTMNRLAEIFLDSIGWSGGNTTMEAIAADLPVVTMREN